MTPSEAKDLIDCDPLHASHFQTWFDLGCGSGLFSKTLIGLLPIGSLIYAVDKESSNFNDNNIKFLQLDFVTGQLPKVSADGILMANSLHYVKDKPEFLTKVKNHLLPHGVFLLIEYETETSNQWVPYPLSLLSAKDLFKQIGFKDCYKINDRPSRFNNKRIYSALFYNYRIN